MTPHRPEGASLNEALGGTLLLAGAGKMGGALLRGWLDKGLDPRRVTVIDPHAPLPQLQPFADAGVVINPPVETVTSPDTLVLAIKPQGLADGAPELRRFVGTDTLLLSIIAGKTIADLAVAFPKATLIARAMPNTPAAVGCGMTGIFVRDRLDLTRKAGLEALLTAVGQVEWLDREELIDCVTAVSGSGPAYVFFLTECLARAAEAAGLAPAAAARLARATVEGAAALMASESETPPSELRKNVTSPNGTTAAALAVLMADDRLALALTDAVMAARTRAEQLSG